LIVAVPEVEGAVKLVVQLALPGAGAGIRLQDEPVNPPGTPASEKLTVPVGVIAVPDVELSVTTAVQVEG
jgi:hypothetical protein